MKTFNKKIITFFLFAVLASTSHLLAQDENRLKTTNQVIGCRLQVAGSNQKTDCRERQTNNRNTELSSEDEIWQQAEFTTNYELPTANCNNSSENLNCYLMMDPVEGEKIVESFEGMIKEAEEAHTGGLQDKQNAIAATGMGKSVIAVTATVAAENACANKIAWKKKAKYFFNRATVATPEHAFQLTQLAQTYTRAAEEAWLAENVWRARAKKKSILKPSFLTKAFSSTQDQELGDLREQAQKEINKAVTWAAKPKDVALSAWAENMYRLDMVMPMERWEEDIEGKVESKGGHNGDLEANSSKHLVNPSVEYALTNHEDASHSALSKGSLFPSPAVAAVSSAATAAPTAYSLQPIASILQEDHEGSNDSKHSVNNPSEENPQDSSHAAYSSSSLLLSSISDLPSSAAPAATPATTAESSSFLPPAGERVTDLVQVLKGQTQQAIDKVISDSLVQLRDYYKKADQAWFELDYGWKEQRNFFHEFQKYRNQFSLSQQKLEQAEKATTDEELQKTRLGKIAKYAGIAGDALGHVPEPHAQVVSAGLSKLTGFVDTINTTWAKVNLSLVKTEHQQAGKRYELAQEQNNRSEEQLLPLEQRAKQLEYSASELAEQAIKKLAEQLHVQSTWKESDWRDWGAFIGSGWGENERFHLVDLARNNLNWVEEITAKSWRQKIEINKEELIILQKKANLVSLERQYKDALRQQKQALLQEEQQQRYLNQGKQEVEELKKKIEKRVDELDQLETRDEVQFERKKKEFIDTLKELEKTQLRFQGLQKKWEEAILSTNRQNESLWSTSKNYKNAKKEIERAMHRIKKTNQIDQELLQKIWLKNSNTHYKDWSLPTIITSYEAEDGADVLEEQRTSEECEPPLQRFEELETQGHNLRLREAMMNSLLAAGDIGKSMIGSVQNLFSASSELSYPQQSNFDQVQEWALTKQIHSTAQDQERWEIREKLDQFQTEISLQRKKMYDSKNLLKEEKANDEQDDDEGDGKSGLSTATKQTSASNGSKALTGFSATKSSVLSFSGKTLFNSNRGSRKKSASALPAIDEENLLSEDPQEQLRDLQEQANDLKKRYFELVAQAESERLSLSNQSGQKVATPFQEEADRNYAWEEADKKSLAVIKRSRHEQEREKIAQEQQESWQMNTERWRVREQADQALIMLKQAQKRAVRLGEEAEEAKTEAQLTGASRKKDEALAEEKRLQQEYLIAEKNWEKMAQEYNHQRFEESVFQEHNYERFKERDQAVNKRWERFIKRYQNPELQKGAVEQEEIGSAVMFLKDQLKKAYEESLIKYRDQEVLNHYREVSFKRALEDAQNHPEEMAEVWEEIAAPQKDMTASQKEINKEAATVFKEEVKRLEKIEKIWRGILEREQEEGKQKSEQVAQEYHRGNHKDWYALSEQTRERYNNEVRKANEEYKQRKEENNAHLSLLDVELQKIEKLLGIVRNKRKKDLLPSSAKRHDQEIIDFEIQQKKLLNEQKDLQENIARQEVALSFGKKATQKENYYRALKKAQSCEQKVDFFRNSTNAANCVVAPVLEASSSSCTLNFCAPSAPCTSSASASLERSLIKDDKNPYWEKALQCYRYEGAYWKEAADDKTSEQQRIQSEKVAIAYRRAAESYQKTAQEHMVLVATQNRSKETLIPLYSEEAKLREQLAEKLVEQQEKDKSSFYTSDIYDLQDALRQVEKKIECYLGTRGAQIEELQENIPLLQKRLEEMNKEVTTLRQQGQEALVLKKETLVTAQQEIIISCKEVLEELFQELPESSERAATVLSSLRAHKTQDQLNQLDQNKFSLSARIISLQNDIKVAYHQGEVFFAKGQEKLLNQAKTILSEIDSIAEQLLARAEKASERAHSIFLRSAQFQKQDKVLQKNATSLRELEQKKNSLQKREETLRKEIMISQSRGELFLNEGQQKLLHEMGTALSDIEQTSKQILTGGDNNLEQSIIFLSQLKQLEERDQVFTKNAPVLLDLEQKKNLFKNRLKNLTDAIAASKNRENKTYLSEARQSLTSRMTQLLFKIDQSAKQLLANTHEALAEAKTLLVQLEELEKRDQQYQKNASDLGKLDEKKSFFQHRLENLSLEFQSSRNQHYHLVSNQQQALANEMKQALVTIDQHAQQLLSSSVDVVKPLQTLLSQLSLLEQRDQRLQPRIVQLKDLIEKECILKDRMKSLEHEISTSQIRGEKSLLQTQKTLLEEIKKSLEQISSAVKQLFDENEAVSNKTSEYISKELFPRLNQLQQRDRRVQDNIFLLSKLEQKKKLLQERLGSLKNEITSLENGRDPLYIQQQQALLASLQQAFDKISPTALWLMEGSDYASEQAKVLLQEIDQFQKSDQELKEDMYNIQKFRQSILRLTSHMGEAKQAFQERKGGEYSYLWDRISTKLEQSRESWEKYSELLSQGKRERALQWKEVAEQSETSTMGIKEALQAYISCDKQKGEALEKEQWGAYYLSDALAWSLKSEEAHEKANQVDHKEKAFWKKLAEQYKNAANDQSKAFEVHHLGKEREAISWGWAGRLAYFNANYQLKALEAQEASNMVLAAGYEEVVETSQGAVNARKLAAERHAAGKLDEGNSWDLQGKSLQSKADYQAKALEAQEAGKRVLASDYREVVESSQRAVDQLKLAAERHAEGQGREGESWRWQGSSLQSQADYRVKAIEAQEAGKAALATGYREAAETSQRAANAREIAAERHLEGKLDEGNSWDWKGKSLQSKADYQAKAIEAQGAGKMMFEAGYREAAETSQVAADAREVAAERYAAGKQSEGVSWDWQGDSLQKKANYQAKVIEAQEADKRELAIGYQKAAEIFQRAADRLKLAAEKKALGKTNEGISWNNQGVSLQSKADYHVKAIEAQEAGKKELAVGYLEAVETSQRAADARELAAERHAAGKVDEGNSWDWQGRSLQSKAAYQVKASEAQEAGKREMAADYLEVAETSQRTADAWKLAAERKAAGKKDECISWDWAAKSLQKKVNYQVKALEAQEAGKKELAEGYRKAAEVSQEAAHQNKLAAESHASEKESEGTSWGFMGKSLQLKADYQIKALEAQEAGTMEIATGYQEVVEISQRATDQLKLSAKKIAEGKESEGMSWQNQGVSLLSKASYQAKARKAQEAKKTALAAGYLQAAETVQRAADQYQLSAEKNAEDKESESTSWFNQGKSLQSKADYQAKGLEAQEAGKREFAVGYLKIAETSQKAADTQKLSAERKAAEKRNEGISWQGQGVSLQSKADYQAKALEAQEAGKGELAAGYLKAAETSQRAANARKLAAEKYVAEKEDEGDSLQNQGISLQLKADYQAKASEAQEAGKDALSAGYGESAGTSQVAADAWKLAAERYATGKKNEGNSCQTQGASLQSKANYQAKAIEAQEAGKAALAAGYQEAAETSQRAADQYKESVRAPASANTSDGNHLFHQAKATQAEADAIARQQSLVR